MSLMEELEKEVGDMRVRAAELSLKLAAEYDPTLQVKLHNMQTAQNEANDSIRNNTTEHLETTDSD